MKVAMEGHFVLNTDQTDSSKTVTVDIPATATVSNHSSCNITIRIGRYGHATSQAIVLMWSEPDPDFPEEVLMRNLTVKFDANTTENIYGVRMISGVYALR